MVTSQQSTSGRDIFFILAWRFPVLIMQHGTRLAEWLNVEDRAYGPFDRYDIDRLGAITGLTGTSVRLELLKAKDRVRQHSSES